MFKQYCHRYFYIKFLRRTNPGRRTNPATRYALRATRYALRKARNLGTWFIIFIFIFILFLV